ncbi:MAG: RIP metalloprotease RseP [Candidatus Omnitrophica bacterium]|nr:RIP metalloprotease RseP [Candidatus Omnitrophota bacterium]MDD5592393.1 RIP metalloprotease RseP [Candidatus Omnitrophota bacterium]
MISIITFLLILGISILVHEFGHFIAAKRLGVKVEKFSLGFGMPLWHKKKGDTEYSINLIPMGGYVKLAGDNLEEYRKQPDEYLSKAPSERAQIIFCGPLLNYILGFLCFWLIFFAGYPTLTTKVGGLIDGFGAKNAGIQAGDKIVAVDGKKVTVWEDLQNAVQNEKTKGKVTLSVLRDNKEYALEVEIKERQLDDILGKKRSVGLIGIMPADEVTNIRYGFLKSFTLALRKTIDLTTLTYKAIWRMITGNLSMRESVTGPLGIFYITSKAASLGIIAVIHLIAVLSISLGIFNLLPLPVLDGGHIVLLAVEKIRGKQLGLKAESIITKFGLTIIIAIALFATYNDLLRFFGDKLSKWFVK